MLQSLPEALAIEKRNPAAASDIYLLEHEYRRYLEVNGLYEPSFEDIVIPEEKKRYALVMPSAFPKDERIAEALRDDPDVMMIDASCPGDLILSKFKNEKEEIRAMFVSIRSLLDKGIPFSDIVITTSAEERLRPYLEEESYLFDIPLEFIAGRSPLSSPAGAFLSSLAEIHSSGYSLSALKSFFLNPAIPFRDHDALVSFIEFATANSITSAPSFANDRFLRVPSSEGGDWYRALRFTLDRLMTETRPDRVLQHVHALMAGLLADEEFSGNESDRDVYSFAMNELAVFLERTEAAGNEGYHTGKPLFPLFLSYLEQTRYVPRKRSGGIRVYPLGQDAATAVRYRFIIALNDDESIRTVRKASFLSDYELRQERTEVDITGNMLGSYAVFSSFLSLSASSETYAGFSLPLSMLGAVEKNAEPDSWREEGLEGRRVYPLQRLGFMNGSLSSLRKIPRSSDFTYGHPGYVSEGPVKLSFSSFDDYRRCPFIYALRHCFGLDRPLSFEPATLDAAEMGSRLHRVLERFYLLPSGNPSEDIPRLFDEEMQAWKDGKEMSAYAMRATDLLVSYIRSVYLDNLVDIAGRMNAMSRPFEGGLEKWISRAFPDENMILSGKIDRLACASDGEDLIIFDYKSSNAFSGKELERRGYQMLIYKLLAENAFPGRRVRSAYFVSLRDGNIKESPVDMPKEDILGELAATASLIASGDWHAQPGDDNCEGCSFRSICRRRFVVR